ncbi:hypothetical protein JKP88DRAFT_244014 [Tribonema minus]|uniref:Uncharacterized protein n=1 Tax=Tribonema minus TaxID=303371 RepID=A0A835Z682_9STRA|nr:hypothetical protein JKP88DRAFT_244014 [Tribonema minus]
MAGDWLRLASAGAGLIGSIPGALLTAEILLKQVDVPLLPVIWGCDAIFVACTLLSLRLALSNGHQRHPKGFEPYRGSFLLSNTRKTPNADPPRAWPLGFVCYHICAGVAAISTPLLALTASLADPALRWSGLAIFAPYMAVFAVQCVLELPMHRSIVHPVVPVAFATHHLWQIVRSLWLLEILGGSGDPRGVAARWQAPVLLWELCFWTFNSAVTCALMPWMYNWSLQQAGTNDAPLCCCSVSKAVLAAAGVAPPLKED